MSKSSLTIATRESPLALWQANWVKQQLEKNYSSLKVTLLGVTTKADKWLETPLIQIGGKGLFVKELEDALLHEKADIAVHSMKDVPMDLPQGLAIPVMCEREDPRDAFVSMRYQTVEVLPSGAIVGTSSLRRQSQLAHWRSDIEMKFLRGNVNTRLIRLDRGEYDAIILAAAGLKRLRLEKCIRSYLSVEQSLPAAGQGVLGIECRADDTDVRGMIAFLNHTPSALCVTAERAMCKRLGGGCHVPVAAYAELQEDKIFLRGLVSDATGATILRAEHRGAYQDAAHLGVQVAEDLIDQGALRLLASVGR